MLRHFWNAWNCFVYILLLVNSVRQSYAVSETLRYKIHPSVISTIIFFFFTFFEAKLNEEEKLFRFIFLKRWNITAINELLVWMQSSTHTFEFINNFSEMYSIKLWICIWNPFHFIDGHHHVNRQNYNERSTIKITSGDRNPSNFIYKSKTSAINKWFRSFFLGVGGERRLLLFWNFRRFQTV